MIDTAPGRYVHLAASDLDDAPVMRGPARYRKRPVEIEAMRYIPPSHANPERGNQGEISDWVDGDPTDRAEGAEGRRVIQPTQHWGLAGHPQCWDLIVQTLEDGEEGGTQVDHIASPGDWIVKGIAGEIYPVKPRIFEQTYEPVTA